MDAARSLFNRDPGAHFPDGYLGTIESNRQADRMVNHIWRSQRAYSRGVHKGERVDQSEYLWPDEFNLMSGVVNQLTTGLRYVSPAFTEAANEGLHNEGKPGPRDFALGTNAAEPVVPDPTRAALLKRLAPQWS